MKYTITTLLVILSLSLKAQSCFTPTQNLGNSIYHMCFLGLSFSTQNGLFYQKGSRVLDLKDKDTVITSVKDWAIDTMSLAAFTGSYSDLSNKPTIPTAPLRYLATTNTSGVDTITFSPAFSSMPIVTATLQNGAINQGVRVYNITQTGCRVHVWENVTQTILGIVVVSNSTTNVNGAKVAVTASEQ